MGRFQVGIVRYAAVARAIADALADLPALGGTPRPDVRLGAGRVTLTIRGRGATTWPAAGQLEVALGAARAARRILASDARPAVRSRATRAVEVVFEDATHARGCTMLARWEAVIPAEATAEG